MNRNFSMALIGVLVTSLILLTACGSENNVRIATGGTSGTYYSYGGVLSEVIGGAIDGIHFDVLSSGASVVNIQMVDSGEVDMAIVQNDIMDYAFNGTFLYSEEPVSGFRSMAAVYAEVCQIIARSDSGIKSITDLKGKRISIGDEGSGVEANSKQILAVYGISEADISTQNLGFSDSAEALKESRIDAFFCTAGTPTTAISELALTTDITILNIDGFAAEHLKSEYPFYTDYTIAAGTYLGQDEDVQTLAVKATLIVNSNLDETLVYQMTKALFENKETISEQHAKGAELDAEYATKGVSVIFHPGAVKYYKEIGVME